MEQYTTFLLVLATGTVTLVFLSAYVEMNLSTLTLSHRHILKTEDNSHQSITLSLNNTISKKDSFSDSCGLLRKPHQGHRIENGVITPDCNTSSFLVYTCGNQMCGGLGDRLRGMMLTYVLALVTNRALVIKQTQPCSLSHALIPNLYHWQHCEQYLSSIDRSETETIVHFTRRKGRGGPRKPLLERVSSSKKRVVIVRTNDVPRSLKGNEMVTPILPGLSSDGCRINSELLHILFKPSKTVSDEIEEFLTKKKDRLLVGSHIRVGINPSNPSDSKSFNVNVSAIHSYLDRYNDSDKYIIYTASDSESTRNEILRRYPNAISTGRRIVHVDKTTSGGEECEGMATAVLEMHLLSESDILVLSVSGFGKMAARIRQTSDNLLCYNRQKLSVVNCEHLKD